MIYITVKQSPQYRSISLEDLLFGGDMKPALINANTSNTRTYAVRFLNSGWRHGVNINALIEKLHAFNVMTEGLRSRPRQELYREFYIPKHSGGLRKIDAPEPELMDALRSLKTLFETEFHALYHTSAFAYIKHRSTIDAVKRHQQNESRWFGKYDLSNFFGSTTLEFVMKMFEMVFPFSEVAKDSKGKEELKTALELAFLNGGLPQGTPISPLITNIMMIPIDYRLANDFRDYKGQRYVYTRYADDFLISSKYTFSFREIENHIKGVLESFGAPFSIKPEKTRYGSSSGSNWNLGVMLNKDNQITVGHKKKKQFASMLASYVMDKKNGKDWDISDVRVMEGLRSYYRMVEGETIDKLIAHIGRKFNVDIPTLIKEDIKG